VPERLDVIGPAHLIVAIEACGSAADLQARVDRAGQLLSDVAAGSDSPLRLSLLSYGPHEHDRRSPDPSVTTLAWLEEDPGVVARRLNWLLARGVASPGRARAAQLECMLAEVGQLLNEPEAAAAGRPVLVTIGERPAFPHRIDPVSRILPCPMRNDWRTILRGLSEAHAGMAFGAIRDGAEDADDLYFSDPADEIWQHLGTDAYARADAFAFNPRGFEVGLGLLTPSRQSLPFPLATPEGAD